MTTEMRAAAPTQVKVARAWDPQKIGTAVIYASLVAVLLERVTAVASDLQLWGDGSWFLIKIASSRSYYLWIADWKRELFHSRLFTILAEQTPTVIATHLPIHSLHVLSLIFGITLYSHALVSLYLCYRYAPQRWHMLFPLLSFFAGTMNVEAYLATDSHFVVSLYWPLLFILLFGKELRRGTLVLLIALSIPTILSYESMMFFGVILAGVCMWRWRRNRQERALMTMLAAWYLAGAGLAVAAAIWPFDPTNRAGFIHAIVSLLHSSHVAAKISLLVLLCCVVLLALPKPLVIIHRLAMAVGMLGIFYLFVEVLVGRTPSSLEVELPARVLNLLLPLAATALLFLVLAGWSKPEARAIGLAAILIGSLGCAQVFWNLAAISRWQGMLATLRYELTLHEGPVPFKDSIMSRQQLGPLQLRDLHAHWPLLPLSLYEAGRGQIQSIILPEPSAYFPFDPYAPDMIPDLSRYGVYSDAYRTTLVRNRQYVLGETLTFPRGGSAAQFMRENWAAPEAWATWGSGPEFGLDLPLGSATLPDAVILRAQVAPNLAPNFPDLTVQVLVNGVPVAEWSFHNSEQSITTRTARVPREVLLRANPVQIRFHVVGTIHSAMEMGKGQDTRRLSLAFLNLSLQPQ